MGEETGAIEKTDVWEELEKVFKDKQLEALQFLADWVEQLEGLLIDFVSKEDADKALRRHRHLGDGTVVEPV